MTEIEKRACEALHQAFCRLRHFSTRDLNELGREHLFMVADAAHNIPDALAGNACHRANLERDVLALEAMLVEPYDIAIGRYLVREESRVSFFESLRSAIGF
ncbi:hypothetical protein ACUXAV_004929 [Cupriavidus metallidurans]|jgi:hypothetical protein|uniref:hypothetical protein n=1 Tax=Cupriavidus TaxID=106589 RepID=UPI0004932F73|nr:MULTISPECIES: hypothetical protein [Cupriavidus]AVA38061.1 hypothetical protein C3Z06_31115 [Cupriavidus metallidurans]MCA3187617.1 hypothetical protein [Cupriavidus sp.]MCA3188602.1 hypothetical protein [Cupriavidus sp.]MCA3231977.1 hypothetical protein [Cupriavidus sp.]MDE4922686.1 hypothetical protein [Cupriavidus metallidurans]